jgi:hypothetical protein
MDIPSASSPSFRYNNPGVRPGQVVEKLTRFFVQNLRSERHFKDKRPTIGTMLFLSPTCLPGLGFQNRSVLEVQKGRLTGGGYKNDIATLSPVSAIRPPPGDIFFAAERHTTMPTFTGLNRYPGFIDKLGHGRPVRKKSSVRRNRFHRKGNDMNFLPVTSPARKLDSARFFGKKRIIPAHPDILSRIELRPSLTDKDISGKNLLAVMTLDSQAL